MRILMIVAVVAFAIAFVCVQVPTVVLTVGAMGWLVLGLLVWALDVTLGGYVAPIRSTRTVRPTP